MTHLRWRRRLGALGLVGIIGLAGCGLDPRPTAGPCPTAAPTAADAAGVLADAATATVRTNKGSFVITLDASSAPIATASLVLLARCGFYDQISFHRVLAGFVIQAGDPQTRSNHEDFGGLGSGGPGYRYEVEFPRADQPYAPYTVAMANAIHYPQGSCTPTNGQDTNGSQFFVTLADLSRRLCPLYSVVGTVTSGTEVVNAIAALPVNDPQSGVPLDPAIIEGIDIGAASGEGEGSAAPS